MSEQEQTRDVESEEAQLGFSLVTEAMAPPRVEDATLQTELSSTLPGVKVIYDPDIPHTEETTVYVRHCTSSITDIHICYQCFGELKENTPVLLLVCGLNMQLYAWDEAFCEGFVRAGFYVIRYDNRDIGLSTKIESRGNVVGVRLLLPSTIASMLGERIPYTLEDMAKDGLALLEVLHIRHAHVMGISMGGMIAQIMCLIAPSRVVSLTSIMSSTNAPDLPDAQMKVKAWLLRKPPPNCSLDTLLEFRINILRRVLPRALSVDSRYLKKRYLISLQRSRYAEGLIRQAAAIIRCPGRDEALRQLTLPALVVHGTQDLIVPPAHGFRTADVLPHSRLLVLKHMGHYFHPAFYQTIIVAFMAMAATTPYPGSTVSPATIFPAFPVEDIVEEEVAIPSPTIASPVTAAVMERVLGSPSAPQEPSIRTLRHSALQPVVVALGSPCGAAVRESVDVRMPVDHSPNTPEAAILDLHPTAIASPDAACSSPIQIQIPSPSSDHRHRRSPPGPLTLSPADGVRPFDASEPSCWNSAVSPATADPVMPMLTGTPIRSPSGMREGAAAVFSRMAALLKWSAASEDSGQAPS